MADTPTEAMDEATQVVDQAREAAVEKVVCPICFEALSDLPNQVGALSFAGHRVETALYHRECVLNPKTGRLVFETETGHAVSPLTRQKVDNFKLMPSLTESEDWVRFQDWNGSGKLDVQKVCFAVAALLPVDDAYARRFVLQVMGLPEDSEEAHELSKKEVIQTLLPQIRRQLRRLIKSPRPRPPEICRNSKQEELVAWYRFWDSNKQGSLDVPTLTLAVVTTFHTALAKSADTATKDAIAHSFLTELGLRETDSISETQFLEKMAPQLVANLPVAIERGHPSGSFDPKLPLTLHMREMKSGSERPLHFDAAGEVTVGDLRKATLRRFPVILCRRKVKLFVMGQLLEDDFVPLFHIRGIYEGATVNFMPGQRLFEAVPVAKSSFQELEDLFDDLEDFDDASTAFDSDEEMVVDPAAVSGVTCQSAPVTRSVSKDAGHSQTEASAAHLAWQKARRANSHTAVPKRKSKPKKAESKPTSKEDTKKHVTNEWNIPSERIDGEEAACVPPSKTCNLLSPRSESRCHSKSLQL